MGAEFNQLIDQGGREEEEEEGKREGQKRESDIGGGTSIKGDKASEGGKEDPNED